MATLTETAYLARKAVNIAVITLVAILILRGVWFVGSNVYLTLFPKKPPPATCAFGPLPPPNAQNGIATPSALPVELEVPSAPTAPTTYKVYFIPDITSSFGSFEQMKKQAAGLGFTGTPQRESANHWQFVDTENSLRTLQFDEISGNFHLSYNFASDLSLFNDKNFSSEANVISKASDFFRGVGFPDAEMKISTPSAVFLKLESGSLVPTTSLANADAVAVTINRFSIAGVPVVSPNPYQGLISAIISGNSDRKKQTVEASYYFHKFNLENSATYPAKTVAQAIDEVKSGKGIAATLPKSLPSSFTVRTVYLAYLDPFPTQSYLQPVYVLSDEKGFTQYVPAVRPDCTKK